MTGSIIDPMNHAAFYLVDPPLTRTAVQGAAVVSSPVVVLLACTLIYLLFLLWYGGRGRPMDAREADALLERVHQTAQAAGDSLNPELLPALREAIRDDDGREFVMVNLIRYRQKAVYPPGWNYGEDPRAADARYNRAILPRLLKRACIPLFLGRSAGRFLTPEGSDSWDCVALVRYRTRRDFLRFCADVAKDRADIHKWAAIEKTHVFPVRVRFSLILIRLVVGGVLALVVLLTFLLG
jgi:hypothetical protein